MRKRRRACYGMHAAGKVLGREVAGLDRANSYIAVMLDDLTLQGVWGYRC